MGGIVPSTYSLILNTLFIVHEDAFSLLTSTGVLDISRNPFVEGGKADTGVVRVDVIGASPGP